MQSDYSLELGRAPTTKAVGSEHVIKVRTDGFSRRKKKPGVVGLQTKETF
jgi:hypothetical protein